MKKEKKGNGLCAPPFSEERGDSPLFSLQYTTYMQEEATLHKTKTKAQWGSVQQKLSKCTEAVVYPRDTTTLRDTLAELSHHPNSLKPSKKLL